MVSRVCAQGAATATRQSKDHRDFKVSEKLQSRLVTQDIHP
jgi:hypothetical protein